LIELLEAVPNSVAPGIDLGIQARVDDNIVAGWAAVAVDNTLPVALVHLLLAVAPTLVELELPNGKWNKSIHVCSTWESVGQSRTQRIVWIWHC